MENIDWDKLAQQESELEQGSEESFLPAYDEDEYALPQSDEEEQEWDYDDGEFTHFVDKDPDEFGFSYAQLEHISYGDLEMGTTIGGKFTKLEKIMQMQTISKEKLYTNKLKVDLNMHFSFGKTNHYAVLVQKVPRFWLKNSQAMASTIFMIDNLEGTKLTAGKLEKYSQQTGIRKEDLFRYYRLLEKYI
jgi:hypothetical protein